MIKLIMYVSLYRTITSSIQTKTMVKLEFALTVVVVGLLASVWAKTAHQHSKVHRQNIQERSQAANSPTKLVNSAQTRSGARVAQRVVRDSSNEIEGTFWLLFII